jgi:ribosome-binding factor A
MASVRYSCALAPGNGERQRGDDADADHRTRAPYDHFLDRSVASPPLPTSIFSLLSHPCEGGRIWILHMAKHRSRETFARGAGFRGQRLEELFREELNSILDGEIADPRLADARVTRVELTRDGSSARIWFVTTSGGEDPSHDELRSALEHASGFIRARLCEALPLKRTPDLRFAFDPAAALQSLELDEKV